MKITVKTYNEWARVFVDGKEVKAFSLLAEDYAITLANDYASSLKKYRKKSSQILQQSTKEHSIN